MTVPDADYIRQLKTEWQTIDTMLLAMAALNEAAFGGEADAFEPVILGALLSATRLTIMRGKIADEHDFTEICRRVYRRAKAEIEADAQGTPKVAPHPEDMSMFEV